LLFSSNINPSFRRIFFADWSDLWCNASNFRIGGWLRVPDVCNVANTRTGALVKPWRTSQMKKSLIALAALAATTAFAQSSVSISGRIDLGVVKTTGASAKLDVTNGANQIRFAGIEDLGGGLKANFVLAQRFSPESGLADGTSQRPTFQGESTVGLSGGFGAIKVGRSLTALQGPVNGTDPYGTLTQGSTAALTTGYATDLDFGTSGSGLGRTDAINYNSPSINGFNVGVTIGLKNSASSGTTVLGAGNLTSVWASYAAGPLMVGGGMEENRTGDKVTAVLATYDLGRAKIGVGNSTVNTVANTGTNGKNTNFMVAVPMGAVTATLGYTDVKAGGTGAKSNKTGLGVTYALSKRTNLYSTYGSTKAKATNTTTTGYDFGIVHSF
jgi:predicted porin